MSRQSGHDPHGEHHQGENTQDPRCNSALRCTGRAREPLGEPTDPDDPSGPEAACSQSSARLPTDWSETLSSGSAFTLLAFAQPSTLVCHVVSLETGPWPELPSSHGTFGPIRHRQCQ